MLRNVARSVGHAAVEERRAQDGDGRGAQEQPRGRDALAAIARGDLATG
eukprot:gene6110-43165_t